MENLLSHGLTISNQVVGRSRGVVIPLDRAYVLEALDISRPPPNSPSADDDEAEPATAAAAASVGPGMVLRYKQVEGAFSNPNGHMAIHTLRWLCARADAILGEDPSAAPRDLLELYCGCVSCVSIDRLVDSEPFSLKSTTTPHRNGNHTMALARKFRRVVGVEINKHLVQVARENLALNGIREGTEAVIIQIPSEKFHPSRLASYRLQQRQEAGKKVGDELPFDFGCVLVDPPRAGLDRSTRKLVSHYDHVLYISCGPQSLLRDLRGEDPKTAATASPEGRKHLKLAPFGLGSTHEVVAMAVLDHFAYCADHIEVAVHLRRRRTRPTEAGVVGV
jgi:tRNA (uracil-5-)-methyltransferase